MVNMEAPSTFVNYYQHVLALSAELIRIFGEARQLSPAIAPKVVEEEGAANRIVLEKLWRLKARSGECG